MFSVSLGGKVALVTGAASGIGRATAVTLAHAGADVVLVDQDASGLEATVALVGDCDVASEAFVFDLMEWRAIPSLVDAIVERTGHIDILVNAAGISDQGRGLWDVADDMWDRVQTINLRSPFILLREVARRMVARGAGGKIVNISSSSAHRREMIPPLYGSAKAGLDLITRAAADELGPHDINVNSVVPGFTRTPIVGSAHDDLVVSGPLANMFKRVSEPEDVANAILFLVLPASRQITGQLIHTSAGNVT